MGWFDTTGAYVLVDGQFGSTGKGLLAAFLARDGLNRITHITTNAGPNSGHTAYLRGENPPGFVHYEKIMTQQVPVASVIMTKLGKSPETILNAGAIIDTAILNDEVFKYGLDPRRILVHPNAAMIDDSTREADKAIVKAIAGTGKGTGPAVARKVLRSTLDAIAWGHNYGQPLPMPWPGRSWDRLWNWDTDVVFVETAQGFSLGVNSARFYPNVTSRECTVMQALADARIPAQALRKVAACYRTYPIRVGDTENSSGGCYPDQVETTWEAIGVEPELTSVTKRVRRVFTWSDIQFRESVAANRPDLLFFNFMNYLKPEDEKEFLTKAIASYIEVMGHAPGAVLLGYGPMTEDISVLAKPSIERV